MEMRELIEAVCAVHLSSRVESPFPERGGLMVVGPPGTLKSTAVMVLDSHYPDVLQLSDVNTQSLIQVRDSIAAGAVRTIVFPELAKVYERHPQTASNTEGTLRALAGEGFSRASFEDQRVNSVKARSTIIGALTPALWQRMYQTWEESGFARRFLWSLIHVADASVLEEAVIQWRRVNFHLPSLPPLPLLAGERIPNLTSAEDRRTFARWVKYQPGGSHLLQTQILSKMLSVLRWWYRETGLTRNPLTTLAGFAQSLGREGAVLTFPEQSGDGLPPAPARRKRKPVVKPKRAKPSPRKPRGRK